MDQTKKNPAARLGFPESVQDGDLNRVKYITIPDCAVPENLRSCPSWESCNANICPLDADWRKRNLLSDESICRFLREWAKIQSGMASDAVFKGYLSIEAQKVIAEAYPEILASHRRINSAMNRAARTQSKLGRTPGVAV